MGDTAVPTVYVMYIVSSPMLFPLNSGLISARFWQARETIQRQHIQPGKYEICLFTDSLVCVVVSSVQWQI